MCLVVDDKVGALAEVLSTFGTLVGLLTRVDLLVGAEVGVVAEALPAHGTLVRPALPRCACAGAWSSGMFC